MKKIYSLVLLAGAALTANAQQAILPTQVVESKFEVETPDPSVAAGGEEFLGLDEFSTSVGITFEAGGGGYLFGTFYQDTAVSGFPAVITNSAVARGFISNDPYNVTGAVVWFALKHGVNASPADLTISLNTIEDDAAFGSAASTAEDAPGPGNEVTSVALPFDDIDTTSIGAPTIAYFASPAWMGGDFSIVVNFEDLYGAEVDTVVVFNEQDGTGEADGTYSWTQQNALVTTPAGAQSLDLWLANSVYELEADFSIFAIVEESGVGIEEQGFLNGVKVTTYPNPAVSSDVVRIQYGLENAAEKVEVNILDMSGKQVFTIVEGDRAAGIHTIDVPAGTLSAGSYVYSLEANGGRIAKQLQVLK